MADAPSPSSIYFSQSGRLTRRGREFFRSYAAVTPTPSFEQLEALETEVGRDIKWLREKFRGMLKYDKGKEAEATNSEAPALPLSVVTSPKVPIATEFLNSISPAQACSLMDKILSSKYKLVLNHRHIDDDIDLEEIKHFTSVTAEDGAYFHDWMACRIIPKLMENPEKDYPVLDLSRGTVLYDCVQPEVRNLCERKNITRLKVLMHHIVLRSKSSKPLPALGPAEDNSGSHLCDTKGCLRSEHLTVESLATNYSRTCCPGVILTLLKQGASPKRIMHIQPCEHGINHPEYPDDPLKFTCRKIQVMIHDSVSARYYKSAP